MLSGETNEHRTLKELIRNKLEEWFGVSITEYSSSGHELDVFSISPNGIKLMVEIVWTPSTTNFFRDLTILLQSDAQIKVLIVNEAILSKKGLVRQFEKVRISEIKKGYTVSGMINGNRILEDVNYLNSEIRKIIKNLINESSISIKSEIDSLSMSLLSNKTKLSPLLAQCIQLSERMEIEGEYLIWLKNELYGYEQYLRSINKQITEPSEFPNNPDYRKIPGKVIISFTDGFKELDKSVLLTHPVAELEALHEGLQGTEFIFSIPKNQFPKIRLDVDKIPITCQKASLARCLRGLTLRLHRYLNEQLLFNIKNSYQ